MPSLNQITPAQLARQIGTPDAPIIIDLRLDEDFADDPRVIPTAKRHSHTTMPEIAVRFAGRQVVVACLRGAKISEGAAAMLRCNGIAAESLAGGHLAWVSAGLPVVRSEILPGTGLWVTRHRPKVDRIACPWLIRRFINPEAQFLFVAPSEVPGVAERFNAIPFDIEDTFWSHRGAECTFDTMIKESALRRNRWTVLPKWCARRIPTTTRRRLRLRGCWRCRSACRGCTAMICNNSRPE